MKKYTDHPMSRYFARFMLQLAGEENPELFLAAGILSQYTEEGHVCLHLGHVAGRPASEVWDDGLEDDILCPDLPGWIEALRRSSVVGEPGEFKPLILDKASRLYLYRYWAYQKTLADSIRLRIAKPEEEEIARDIDILGLQDGLRRLFPDVSDKKKPDWQKIAALVAVLRRFCLISGGPGTGKTSTVVKVFTIHRLLGPIHGSSSFLHHEENLLPYEVVIIDEASMVDLPLMAKLIRAIPISSRLILLGDKDQLSSVEPGAVLGDIYGHNQGCFFSSSFADRISKISGEIIPKEEIAGKEGGLHDSIVTLRQSYRFGADTGIGQLSQAVRAGEGKIAMGLLKGDNSNAHTWPDRFYQGSYQDISWRRSPKAEELERAISYQVIHGYSDYLKADEPGAALGFFNQFRLLCAVRQGYYGVSNMNKLIEKILQRAGLIQLPRGYYYRGQPLMITRNDYSLQLFNGDIGLVWPDPAVEGSLRAYFPAHDGSMRRISPSRLPEHETVYAMTVHKSQGSEFDRVLLLLPDHDLPLLSRELIYTAITRAREHLDVWAREEPFLQAVSRTNQRQSGLEESLWGR